MKINQINQDAIMITFAQMTSTKRKELINFRPTFRSCYFPRGEGRRSPKLKVEVMGKSRGEKRNEKKTLCEWTKYKAKQRQTQTFQKPLERRAEEVAFFNIVRQNKEHEEDPNK